jgi:chromatin modification-related protein VID21
MPHPNAQAKAAAQARQRMSMPSTPNGTGAQTHSTGGLVPPMQMNGNSHVQMPVVNGQARMAMPAGQPDIQTLLQAQRISEQQRQSVQMRQQQPHQNQQQGHAMQNSPSAMRAALSQMNQKNFLNSPQAQAMLASMNGANGSGMSTPPGSNYSLSSNTMSQGTMGANTMSSVSPPPAATLPQQTHQTYVSQLQIIESQIRQANPNTPQDMVRQMARQLLQNRHNNLTQSAMNAAAGGQTAAANGPHQYAQLLRAQQQQQAAAAAQAQAQVQAQQAQQAQQVQQAQQHQRNSSGSATPTPSVTK